MTYPDNNQVNNANLEQLVRWQRFLPGPGITAIGTKRFDEVCTKEAEILRIIEKRIESLGGITPEISKRVGW